MTLCDNPDLASVPPSTKAAEPKVILVVDDSPMDRLLVGRTLERELHLRVVYAGDGVEAMTLLTTEHPIAVVTDLQMPEMDGLELVRTIREKYPSVPVILMTGNGSEEIAIEALRVGAASYVPKRNIAVDLIPNVEQVLAASQTDERRTRILGTLSEQVSRYVLESDPALVSPLVQIFREELIAFRLCDATDATRAGIALEEALLNAVYHGNLGVSSDLKLLGDGSFERVAAARRLEAPYSERRVKVSTALTPSAATFVIEDEGMGFDVSQLPDPTDPENLLRPSGRGVLFMRTFMDEVHYNATGNTVTLIKRRGS